jgi:hypothetical protein
LMLGFFNRCSTTLSLLIFIIATRTVKKCQPWSFQIQFFCIKYLRRKSWQKKRKKNDFSIRFWRVPLSGSLVNYYYPITLTDKVLFYDKKKKSHRGGFSLSRYSLSEAFSFLLSLKRRSFLFLAIDRYSYTVF